MPTQEPRPRPVDVHVGTRVRSRRTLLGLSQQKLGAELGLTFQQVQKYEQGTNRIGASRLYELSQILGVPVGYFFDDMPGEITGDTPRGPAAADAPDGNVLSKRETLELVRAFYRIEDNAARAALAALVKTLAD